MNDLLCAASALASLLALTHWARAVPTRAWGDAASPSAVSPQRAWAVVLGTLLLQTAAATVAAGWAAGIALVVAAWMGLGWLLVMAMNQWPQASLRWAQRVGWAGGCVCVAALVAQGLWLGADNPSSVGSDSAAHTIKVQQVRAKNIQSLYWFPSKA